MEGTRKTLLTGLLAVIVAVILLTWGSIGSAILTLGLLLSGLVIALRKSLQRQEEDYFNEDSL